MSYFGIPIRNGLPIGLGTVAPLGINTFSPFSPASFFANGEQGWWYDPSNFATLFQDSAGTTPVTAVEQPVGLQLDLSKGAPATGPELVTNGDFSSATGWSTTGGWSISGGNLVGTVAANSASQNSVTTAGVWYKVSFNYSATLGNVIRICNTSGTALISFTTSSGTSGAVTGYFFATGSTVFIEAALANYTGTIDNFSIKALAGNHRFQSTSANRPVVSARVNLLTKTEQFDNAAWLKQNTTATANSVVAPDGTTTADKIIETVSLAQHSVYQAIPAVAGVNYKMSVYGKAAERRYLSLFLNNFSAGATFDLQTGTVVGTPISSGGATSSIVSAGNGWYLCIVSGTASGTATENDQIGIGLTGTLNSTISANESYLGDGTSGIYIWGADLRPTNQGVGLPAYQRVNTSTDYDSTGFPVYIKPNGSNQFMQTNSINFSSTDKMTVWQGVRKLSDATLGMLTELSVNSGSGNNGAFGMRAPYNAATADYGFLSNGTAAVGAVAASFAAPTTNVITGIGNISGPSATLRVNSTQVANVTSSQGTGNYGNYPAYFYARAGSAFFFSGHDYGSIARGAASTAAQITAGETYINSKTKAYT